MLGEIAKGAFGKVYRVSLKDNYRVMFAMKVQNKSGVISQDAVKQTKDEVSIHESLGGCVFIAKLYASWQNRTKLFTVMHYAGFGDLFQLNRDSGPLNEDVVKIYAAEIAMALDYMHTQSIIYRDLKTENIVLDDNGHVQVVDFGLAKWLSLGDRTKTICGTLAYMAPEVATQLGIDSPGYEHAVDWFSLGVLLHILLSGSIRESGIEGKRAFPEAEHHWQLSYPTYHPPDSLTRPMRNFLRKLLHLDSERRIRSLSQLQSEEAFQNINLQALQQKQVHPFDYIPKMRHCDSHNQLEQGSYMDTEEELAAFNESFQATFTEVDYADE